MDHSWSSGATVIFIHPWHSSAVTCDTTGVESTRKSCSHCTPLFFAPRVVHLAVMRVSSAEVAAPTQEWPHCAAERLGYWPQRSHGAQWHRVLYQQPPTVNSAAPLWRNRSRVTARAQLRGRLLQLCSSSRGLTVAQWHKPLWQNVKYF